MSSTFKPSFHGTIKRVMILMMMADGKIEDSEIAKIGEIYHALTGEQLTSRQLDEEIVRARFDGRSIRDFLSVLAKLMDNHDKEMVIRAAHMVALADSDFNAQEQKVIHEVGAALEMSPRQIAHIMSATPA